MYWEGTFVSEIENLLDYTVQTRNTVSNAHKMIPPLPNVLYGKVLVLLWKPQNHSNKNFK